MYRFDTHFNTTPSPEYFENYFEKLSKNGAIGVSVGECESLIQGAKLFEQKGNTVSWIRLQKDGTLNLEDIKNQNFQYLFVSPYMMDTFLKIPKEQIQKIFDGEIISQGYLEEKIDKDFETVKKIFLETLQNYFGDQLYFFVDNNNTLPFTLHFALKNMRAREIIRTLRFHNIFLVNGERCAIGIEKPSRILEEMGYPLEIARNALSLSFTQNYQEDEIEKIVMLIYNKHKQLLMLQ